MRKTVWIAAATLLALHLFLVWRAIPRALDHDEGEHLRATAWMASGKTIYRDFSENHTPFLYLLLAPLVPRTDTIDSMRHYVTAARVASAIAGTLAVLCVAAVAAQLAGEAAAAIPVLAVLLATSWLWLRGLADVRAEPYTLLLFWGGTLLVVAARKQILWAGVGVGLIAVAGVWNPKWPLESVVVFAQYVMLCRNSRRRAVIGSLLIAAALPLIAVCIALRVATPSDLYFHSFVYARAIAQWFRTSPLAGAFFGNAPDAFAFCPLWLRPLPALAFALALIALWRRRALFPIALLAAAALEIRFLYPYPRLWPQYLVMWGCVVAMTYGIVIAQLRRFAPIAAAVIVIAWIAYEWPTLTRPVDERHWALKAELLRRLQPGDAAWVRAEELPVRAPAGSYYWYAFADQVPFSLEYARQHRELPSLRDEDLPPCRILAGLEQHVRLIDSRTVINLPRSRECLIELRRRGAIVRVGTSPIWEVIRTDRVQSGGETPSQ